MKQVSAAVKVFWHRLQFAVWRAHSVALYVLQISGRALLADRGSGVGSGAAGVHLKISAAQKPSAVAPAWTGNSGKEQGTRGGHSPGVAKLPRQPYPHTGTIFVRLQRAPSPFRWV